MSLDAARGALVAEIVRAKTAWTEYTLAVEYDNMTKIDLAKQVKPYLLVQVRWSRSVQQDLGPRPNTTDYGSILLSAGVKQGQDVTQLLKLLQHFRPYLQLRDNLGANVHTHAASMHDGRLATDGFYYESMSIPFWLTEQSPAIP